MKTFLRTCAYVRKKYPKLWEHSRTSNRLIMVRYHLPGEQLLFWDIPTKSISGGLPPVNV